MPSQPSLCLLITQISTSDVPKTTTKYLQISVGKKKERNGRVFGETCKLLSLVNGWLRTLTVRCLQVGARSPPLQGSQVVSLTRVLRRDPWRHGAPGSLHESSHSAAQHVPDPRGHPNHVPALPSPACTTLSPFSYHLSLPLCSLPLPKDRKRPLGARAPLWQQVSSWGQQQGSSGAQVSPVKLLGW